MGDFAVGMVLITPRRVSMGGVLDVLERWFTLQACFLTAVVATLLLLAGLLLSRSGGGLRQMPLIAMLLGALAIGGWVGVLLLWYVELNKTTATRLTFCALVASPLLMLAPHRAWHWWQRFSQTISPRWQGARGEVYRRIARGGQGHVKLRDEHREVILPAVAHDIDLPPFTAVKVVAVQPCHVVVEAVSK